MLRLGAQPDLRDQLLEKRVLLLHSVADCIGIGIREPQAQLAQFLAESRILAHFFDELRRVLIELLEPVSGAHFNPLVTLVVLFQASKVPVAQTKIAQAALLLIAFQLLGAVAGAWLANAMFDLSLLQFSSKVRGGWGQWLGETVATGGLILVVLRAPPGKAAGLVACHIGAAYWFTSSTSFANPAAVLGRILSDSFAGIAPGSAAGFVAAQIVGAAAGVALHRALGNDD